MTNECRSCRYFVPHEQLTLRMESSRFAGECRVNPPVPRTHDHVPACPIGLGVFPFVLEADWCGRFEPKSSPAASGEDLRLLQEH
jgi:hypothetical protein